jgi:hypothetical protein
MSLTKEEVKESFMALIDLRKTETIFYESYFLDGIKVYIIIERMGENSFSLKFVDSILENKYERQTVINYNFFENKERLFEFFYNIKNLKFDIYRDNFFSEEKNIGYHTSKLNQFLQIEEYKCSVCLEYVKKDCKSLCGHHICRKCHQHILQNKKKLDRRCPICRNDKNFKIRFELFEEDYEESDNEDEDEDEDEDNEESDE